MLRVDGFPYATHSGMPLNSKTQEKPGNDSAVSIQMLVVQIILHPHSQKPVGWVPKDTVATAMNVFTSFDLCAGVNIHDGGNLVFPVFILEDPL